MIQRHHTNRKGPITDEEFNEMLKGPLHHPMPVFIITRLMLALRDVVESTGDAGANSLRRHCAERQRRDEAHG